jgi:hypothetical protein
MTLLEFTKALGEIGRYLGSPSNPSSDVIAAWFERVERIPSEAVPFITRRITDDAERMPKNLPKLFRELYWQWMAEHPRQSAPAQEHFCGQCYDGILWLRRGDATAAIFCACYRGNPGQVGRSTLATMREQGWSLIDLTGHGTPAEREALAGQIQSARRDYYDPDPLRVDDYEDQPW